MASRRELYAAVLAAVMLAGFVLTCLLLTSCGVATGQPAAGQPAVGWLTAPAQPASTQPAAEAAATESAAAEPAAAEPSSPAPATTGPAVRTEVPTPAQPTPAATIPVPQTTTPVTPATEPSATEPSATSSGGGSSSPLLWVFVAIGALALLGLIAWFTRSSSLRSDATAAWQSRRRAAYAEGAALHDALMSAEGQPGSRWTDVQRRADDFTQRLYQLREAAPDEDSQARVEDVLISLRALRSALDAERAAGITGGMTAQVAQERLNDFRAALSALRGDY